MPDPDLELRQSSITVAIRVRPFNSDELTRLVHEDEDKMLYLRDSTISIPSSAHNVMSSESLLNQSYSRLNFKPVGIRKIVDCVDDKMLVFDPSKSNPLNELDETFARSASTESRRRIRRFGEQKFIFDKIFDVDASQQDVYTSTTQPLLDSIIDGFNATIFAYGATGCGKTYTISGTPDHPGIIFLTMQELFQRMEQLSDIKQFQLTVSYLEIYNEQIHDLLKPETPSKKLVVREDSEKRTFVSNLSHYSPENVQEVMDLVIKGNMNRTTSPTDANATSSRSHAVLQIHVSQTDRSSDLKQNTTFATLSIIDLAGSERASATKNRGERLFEGANINKSLLALGNCINALCVSSTRSGLACHVPYRDSKLTRLLKFSLGGNCKTVMIVCISPSNVHYDETLNALKYANRAKEIKTKVIRNKQSLDRHVSSYLKMITQQKEEIDDLKTREKKMIQISLTRFQNDREKIYLGIKDSIREIRKHIWESEKIQHLKLTKSLAYVKKYYLKLVHSELGQTLMFLSSLDDPALGAMVDRICLIQEHLVQKMKELEIQFGEQNEISSTFEYMKTIHLKKLSDWNNWDKETDHEQFEMQLQELTENLQNEILVNCISLLEKLLDDPILSPHYQILSHVLMQGIESLNSNLDNKLNNLSTLDEEFDHFAYQLNASQRKRASPKQKQQPIWRQKIVKQSLQNTPIKDLGPSSNNFSHTVFWSEPQDVSMMMDDTDPIPFEQNQNISISGTPLVSQHARKPKVSLTSTQLR